MRLITLTVLAASTLAMSACSSVVSEETCLAGNWEAQGFKDGANGKSVNRLSKIIETCQEYGTSVDDQAYWAGYEAGLPRYCTYQRGFETGERGSSYNQVCSGDLAQDYAPGYDDGRQRYAIYQQHDDMVDRYNHKRNRLYDLRQEIQDPELTDRQRDNLRYKIRRLENEMDNLRYNLRQFERQHNLPKHSF